MPQTKTISSERKPARAAQPDRKSIPPGKLFKSRRNGFIHSPVGENRTTMRDNNPPAIKISMSGRPGVFVDLKTLPKGTCLLDTEAKLLIAMEDLYPLVSRSAGFKDNTRWNKRSSVANVFDTFFKKLLKLQSIGWGQIILSSGVYKLRIKEPIYFDVTCPVMPVYFIAELEKQDKKLFDLFFYLVVSLFRHSKIQLWDDDNNGYIYDNIEQNLAEYKTNGDHYGPEHQDHIKGLEEAYKEYASKGPASQFYNRIVKAGISKRIWLKAFEEYKPKTPLQKDAYSLLRLGKELIEKGEKIFDFISMAPDMSVDIAEYDEMPETPDAIIKLVWRNDDYWFEEFASMVDSINRHTGSLPFFLTKIIEQPSDFKEVENCFPQKLLRFMKAARDFESKYRPTFRNPGKLKKALTPKPKYLIDIL